MKHIVRTFSRVFPDYHPKVGVGTFFVEKIWNHLSIQISYKLICDLNPDKSPELLWAFWRSISHDYYLTEIDCMNKSHTIRAGHHFKPGDFLVPRVWSGKPYKSKQIQIAPPIEIVKTWDFECHTEADDRENDWSFIRFLSGQYTCYSNEYLDPIIKDIALNDGFSDPQDFLNWVQPKDRNSEPFLGQIICWNKSIEYLQPIKLTAI